MRGLGEMKTRRGERKRATVAAHSSKNVRRALE
jgi:hypothetical protein